MSDKSGYFPFFIDISNKRMVFIGAGKIAGRRISSLSRFKTQITVIAPDVCTQIKELSDRGEILYIKDFYKSSYIEDADIVFACTNDRRLNHEIILNCKKLGIWSNNCSDKDECDFYFPAVVKRDEIVVGINAGGQAHKKVGQVRKKIEDTL